MLMVAGAKESILVLHWFHFSSPVEMGAAMRRIVSSIAGGMLVSNWFNPTFSREGAVHDLAGQAHEFCAFTVVDSCQGPAPHAFSCGLGKRGLDGGAHHAKKGFMLVMDDAWFLEGCGRSLQMRLRVHVGRRPGVR